MLYKVWARCCTRKKYIEDAKIDDLNDAFERIFDDAINSNLIDIFTSDDEIDIEKEEEAFNKISEYFEKNKMINCGDWMIVETDDKWGINIPNMCGYDSNIIF